ncbi:uncharacterized protein [Globicephala melas]|uniref:uncharacterized protein n=1 Tax=Globicephala melas TaxID=9731 RepID=UPI00293D3D12|nr:collagen alpha-1(I) chain-like isoform X1 [Globicephala melas]
MLRRLTDRGAAPAPHLRTRPFLHRGRQLSFQGTLRCGVGAGSPQDRPQNRPIRPAVLWGLDSGLCCPPSVHEHQWGGASGRWLDAPASGVCRVDPSSAPLGGGASGDPALCSDKVTVLVAPGGAGLAGAAVPPGEVTSDLGPQDATARGWGPGAGGWAGGRSTPSLSCRPPALGCWKRPVLPTITGSLGAQVSETNGVDKAGRGHGEPDGGSGPPPSRPRGRAFPTPGTRRAPSRDRRAGCSETRHEMAETPEAAVSAVLGGSLPRFRCIWTLAWDWGLGSASDPSGRPHREGGAGGGAAFGIGSWTQETEGCPSPQTRAARAGHQATSCCLHSPASSAQGEPPSGDGQPLQALEPEARAASVPPPRTLSAPRLLSAAPATPALPQILSTLNHHALRAHHDLAGPSTARLLPALPLVGLQGPPHPSTCSPWSQAAAPAAPRAQSGRAPLRPAR